MTKTDKAGTVFDADLHEMTAKGNPRTKGGLFIPKQNEPEVENGTFLDSEGNHCVKDAYDTIRLA